MPTQVNIVNCFVNNIYIFLAQGGGRYLHSKVVKLLLIVIVIVIVIVMKRLWHESNSNSNSLVKCCR